MDVTGATIEARARKESRWTRVRGTAGTYLCLWRAVHCDGEVPIGFKRPARGSSSSKGVGEGKTARRSVSSRAHGKPTRGSRPPSNYDDHTGGSQLTAFVCTFRLLILGTAQPTVVQGSVKCLRFQLLILGTGQPAAPLQLPALDVGDRSTMNVCYFRS